MSSEFRSLYRNPAETVTVISECCGRMIIYIFSPALQDPDLNNMWFQKDVGTCYTTRANLVLFAREISLDLVIFSFGDIN